MTTSNPQHDLDRENEASQIKVWDHTAVRVLIVLFGVAIWLAAGYALLMNPAGILDSDTEITPVPDYVAYKISDETRSRLSTEVLELLTKMESGQVSGRFEKDFRATFKQATSISYDGRFRRYWFALGKKKIEELNPVITVDVHRKTGRIIRCSLWTCCS